MSILDDDFEDHVDSVVESSFCHLTRHVSGPNRLRKVDIPSILGPFRVKDDGIDFVYDADEILKNLKREWQIAYGPTILAYKIDVRPIYKQVDLYIRERLLSGCLYARKMTYSYDDQG